MKGKRRPAKFSAVKAVKANARERVGQPKPGRVIADRPREEGRGQKHKKSLSNFMNSAEE